MDQVDAILSFPAGLIGFPALKAFRLFEPRDSYPLKFLQAVDRKDISFTCVDVQARKTLALNTQHHGHSRLPQSRIEVALNLNMRQR